jgi:hypothetical protein
VATTDLAAGPVWSDAVGAPYTTGPQCDAAAVSDGTHLYVAGNQTTVNNVSYAGSIRMLDPATGGYLWQQGLAGAPIGSPTMDGSGVIAVTEYAVGSVSKSYELVLLDAATGAVLNSINVGPDFGQPVFADNMLFVSSQNRGLLVYRPSGGTPTVTSINPSSFAPGATNTATTIAGTNFVSGATVTSHTGVSVTVTSFVSSTQLNVTVTISGTLAAGKYNVFVHDPNGSYGECKSCLTVS